MKPENLLSKEYHQVKAILQGGWKGTYGDLATCIGRTPKSGRVIGRLVRSFAQRYPDWDHANCVAKLTGLPAYQHPSSQFQVEL